MNVLVVRRRMPRYPNYYAILQVSQSASPSDIKRAWKSLLRKTHPDVGGNEDEASLVNEAYSVLKDPARRVAYDRLYVAYVVGENGHEPSHVPANKNKRRVKRVSYVNEIFLQKNNSQFTGQSQDISLYGIRLRSTQKLNPSDVVELSFAQDPGFAVEGAVKWNRMIPQRFGNPVYEVGVEFKGMHMERFVDFLERSGLATQVGG